MVLFWGGFAAARFLDLCFCFLGFTRVSFRVWICWLLGCYIVEFLTFILGLGLDCRDLCLRRRHGFGLCVYTLWLSAFLAVFVLRGFIVDLTCGLWWLVVSVDEFGVLLFSGFGFLLFVSLGYVFILMFVLLS